jgi:hypothetical protein
MFDVVLNDDDDEWTIQLPPVRMEMGGLLHNWRVTSAAEAVTQ